ncbi:MAG: DUF1611 domain-containing protein [Actinomycetota bacterium]|nr:DUF1611 domain-containing protein [Actinomycetota bacterium]
MSVRALVEEKGSMNLALDRPGTKVGFATRAVPLEEMVSLEDAARAPEVGDLVMTEVLRIGRHAKLETQDGRTMNIFPGDRVLVAFGHRYAPDQYEGYVPNEPVEECDLLSVGGVVGEVASRHDSMAAPTRLRVMGAVCDGDGRPLNTRSFGLPSVLRSATDGVRKSSAEVILVIGSSMNSGKTTTVGTIARALSRAGFEVAAGKMTGTAAGKDGRFFESCGARPVVDFTAAGYPSTYMLGREELLSLYHSILSRLHASNPDYIIVEIADGVFQRETRMMIESEAVLDTVDHLVFAAPDSLSTESGVRFARERGLPLRATTGAITQSDLAVREAEEATGVPCLNTQSMLNGDLVRLLDASREKNPEDVPEESPAAGFVEKAHDAVTEAVDAVTGTTEGAPANAVGRGA